MSAPDTDAIRQQLLGLRTELQALEAEYKSAEAPIELDQARVGRLSRMDAMQAQQMAQENSRRRQHQLLKIEDALRRIESGDFGYCFICGEEIGARRLEFDPANTRCMECADK